MGGSRLFKRKIAPLVGALALGCVPALAQIQSFSTAPQGSAKTTMASVISGQARESQGMKPGVQPDGSGAQSMQTVKEAWTEFSLNDVKDVITAVSDTADHDAMIQSVHPVFHVMKVQPALPCVCVNEPMHCVTSDKVLLAVLFDKTETIGTAHLSYPGVSKHNGARAFFTEHGIEMAPTKTAQGALKAPFTP